ncbi:MAG: SCO family protein, partial [Flavobacteriaceae bacterium]|nr:SCO family protein [Flavobacteriaceae bacterium]
MKKYSYILVIAIAFFSCQKEKQVDKTTTLPFFNTATFTPEWIGEESARYNEIHTIPEFSFVNQNGEDVTQKTYEGKIYVADFFFVSCPGICPRLTKNMTTLQEEYQNDGGILLLSHTVMPWRDSVSELKKYAIENKINANKWNLVTGDKDEIYNLARTAYFADED